MQRKRFSAKLAASSKIEECRKFPRLRGKIDTRTEYLLFPLPFTGNFLSRSTILPDPRNEGGCGIVRPPKQAIQGITAMPKQKTHKGMKKRFTVTASGKAKCRSPYRGHLQSHKPSKRKRQNRVDTVLVGVGAAKIVEGLRAAGL